MIFSRMTQPSTNKVSHYCAAVGCDLSKGKDCPQTQASPTLRETDCRWLHFPIDNDSILDHIVAALRILQRHVD